MTDPYEALTYGARKVGFGERIGIAVVDLQRGFTQPEFPQGGSQLVVSATEATSILLDASRACDIPVVTCAMGYQSESDMPKWKIEAMYGGSFFVGSEGLEIDPRVYDPDYDYYIIKSSPSIFFATPAQPFFVKKCVDTVIVCGCMTSGCVRASVIDAFSHGYRVIIPRECVGDIGKEAHDANLLDIERRYADVIPMQEVLECISSG